MLYVSKRVKSIFQLDLESLAKVVSEKKNAAALKISRVKLQLFFTGGEESKATIEKQFDDIFQQQTSHSALNHQLKKTFQKKSALLGTLEKADSLLHNNFSETAARSAKTKLKVFGGTRSDEGRDARDTFLSLIHTCRKLEINFISSKIEYVGYTIFQNLHRSFASVHHQKNQMH